MKLHELEWSLEKSGSTGSAALLEMKHTRYTSMRQRDQNLPPLFSQAQGMRIHQAHDEIAWAGGRA
jgi:hypothetical protein